MTRHALFALPTVALLVAACSPPDDPAVRATPAAEMPTPSPPVLVHVQVPDGAGPEPAAWAEELQVAVREGHGDLSPAATPEEAVVVVRIDSVETGVDPEILEQIGVPVPEGEGEISLMKGAFLIGESAREFRLAYRGEVRPQAEALARNLRGYAAEADLPEPEDDADEADPEG